MNTNIKSNYQIMMAAWRGLKGFKATFWSAIGIVLLLTLLLGAVMWPLDLLINNVSLGILKLGFVNQAQQATPSSLWQLPWGRLIASVTLFSVDSLLRAFVLLPLFAGIWMISIQQGAHEKVKARQVLAYLNRALPLFIGQACVFFLVGFIILVGIFIPKMVFTSSVLFSPIFLKVAFVVTYFYSIFTFSSFLWFVPLMVDKKLTVYESLTQSRDLFKNYKYKIASLYTLLLVPLLLLMIIAGSLAKDATPAMSVLIGLLATMLMIWFVPWIKLAGGILYSEMTKLQDAHPSNDISDPQIDKC